VWTGLSVPQVLHSCSSAKRSTVCRSSGRLEVESSPHRFQEGLVSFLSGNTLFPVKRYRMNSKVQPKARPDNHAQLRTRCAHTSCSCEQTTSPQPGHAQDRGALETRQQSLNQPRCMGPAAQNRANAQEVPCTQRCVARLRAPPNSREWGSPEGAWAAGKGSSHLTAQAARGVKRRVTLRAAGEQASASGLCTNK